MMNDESGIHIRNFLNALSRVEIFEYAMNPQSCERLIRIFLSGDVTRPSPGLYPEYCIQHDNLAPKFSLLPVFTTHALLPNPRGVLSTRMNPDTCRIRVDGQIRLEYGYVWMWKFKNPEKKARIQKYPDTCGWGLPFAVFARFVNYIANFALIAFLVVCIL